MSEQEIVDKAKMFLGSTSWTDEQLGFMFNSVRTYALNYCNIQVIPDNMGELLVEMLLAKVNNFGVSSGSEQAVKSMSDGSQSMSFDTVSADNVVSPFHSRLQKWRPLPR